MSYPETVRYLYALGNELKPGVKMGLERISTLLEALGHPERRLKLIHVAGTNGKGSTCAMIASVLQATGERIGLYTSPHLSSPTERIRRNGECVSEEEFAAAFETVHRTAEELLAAGKLDAHPSYFETVTAMAFVLFDNTTDRVVCEVGLGGRYDATNVIIPQISVITPVDYDHEAFLGNTLTSIADEKAGIIKPGVPVVVGEQHREADMILVSRARQLHCELIRASDVFPLEVNLTPYDSRFTVEGVRYSLPLPGRHQIENALTAILTCQKLGIAPEFIQKGLSRVHWAGRLEFLSHRPDMVLDGAHNPAGARALGRYIREFCSQRPVWMVYGAMRDKAIEEVTNELFPLADKLILTAPHFPRALRPEVIFEMTDHTNVITAPDIPAAIELAYQAPPDAIVFFTGSLFVVAEARTLLRPSA